MKKHLIAIAASLVMGTATSSAQEYPARHVTMVVPFAAGGPSDVVGRVVAQRMAEILKQQVVVENVTGAGGTIGATRVAKAAPDGYQILLGNVGTHGLTPSLFENPPYDAVKDFEPVALLSTDVRVLLTRRDFPAKTLPDFIKYVKANHKKLQFASGGVGSTAHAGCLLLNNAMGVEVTHVPYRGAGPAMQDMIGGRIDYMCDSLSSTLSSIKGGSLNAVAILSGKRSEQLPGVPTAQEQGLAGFDVSGWQAIFVPKGTPRAAVNALNKAAVQTMDTPSVRKRLEELGETIVPVGNRTPEYLSGFVSSEIKRWAGPIKASGVKVK